MALAADASAISPSALGASRRRPGWQRDACRGQALGDRRVVQCRESLRNLLLYLGRGLLHLGLYPPESNFAFLLPSTEVDAIVKQKFLYERWALTWITRTRASSGSLVF